MKHASRQEVGDEPPRRTTAAVATVVLLAGLGLVSLLGLVGAEQAARRVDADFRRDLLRHAISAASAIDPELAAELSFSADDQGRMPYGEIWAQLLAFGHALPDHDIYSFAHRDGRLVFGPSSYTLTEPRRAPPGTVYTHPPPEADDVLASGRPAVFGPHTSGRGTHITALAPVTHPRTREQVMVVGLSVPDGDWETAIKAARRPALIRAAIVVIALLGAALLLINKYRLPEDRQWRWRHLETQLILFVGLAITAAVSLWVIETEQRERRATLDSLAELHAAILQEQFDRIENHVATLARFYLASEHIDPGEFNVFTAPMLDHQLFRALGWIETGTDEARITDYIEPKEVWREIHTLDHSKLDNLAKAIAYAEYNVRHLSVALVDWPTPDPLEPEQLYFMYQAVRTQDGEDGQPRQTGLVFAVTELGDLLQESFQRLAYETPLICVRIEDVSDEPHRSHSVHYPASIPDHQGLCPVQEQDRLVHPLAALGRAFRFTVYPTPHFFKTYPARSGQYVGVAGLLLTLLVAGITVGARQRQHTQDLARNEKKYRRLFEAMTAGFALHEMVLDKQGKPVDYRFLEINQAFEQHTGLKGEELIGRTLYEALPDSEPFWLARYAPVAMQGNSIRFDHYDVLLNRHFGITAYSPQRGQFAVLISDITERKGMEEKLARNESLRKLLTDMATRFISLPTDQLDEATQAALQEVAEFIRVDRAYRYRYDFDERLMVQTHAWCDAEVSPQAAPPPKIPMQPYAHWVATHQEGGAVTVPDAEQLPPDDPTHALLAAQGVRSLITVPLMTGSRCIGFIGFDALRSPRAWRDDEIELLQVLSRLLANAYVRREDEIQHRRLEQQVQQAQKLESLGILAGGIAHDFNNILTTILGNADLALLDISPLSPVRANLKDIEVGARRAADLCRQMLAYAGKSKLLIDTFCMNDLIEEMLHLLQTSISKQAVFNLHLEPRLPAIKGDASQIRQIILNLVLNASEALGEGGGTITVRTGTLWCNNQYLKETLFDFDLKPGLFVTLEVADTGCGMDKQTLAQMFDPFFTTKFTGRGLGLSSVMGIVRSHEGALRVYSEVGKGTAFKLMLPAAQGTAQPADQPAQTDHAPNWQGGGAVLLVEDEEAIRSLAGYILERLGFKVYAAADGVEALELHAAHRDELVLVLLDLTMPRKSGEETLHDLRACHPELPVVIASGYSKDEIAARLAAKGVAAFVQKPYSMSSLGSTLSRILESKPQA